MAGFGVTTEGHKERLAQVVSLRYFGGLQLEEIAGALSISLATVKRDLTLGEAWLRRALSGLEEQRNAD
jgi:RNA polymerase sigma-70 factor, ECF subfamily